MGYLVRMPQMGMEMEQGTVVSWELAEGEAAAEGDVIAVVESEKAANDVEAREDGALRRVVVPEGGAVEPGTPIGVFAAPDEDVSDLVAEAESAAGAAADPPTAGDGSAAGGAGESTASGGAGEAAASTAGASGSSGASGSGDEDGAGGADASDVRATPGARQAAEERGVSLSAVTGTGPQGVVTEDDVESHAAGSDGAEAAAASASGASGSSEASAGADANDAGGADASDVRATPGARRLAEERGVSLSAVTGTGPQGVVTEDDVESHADAAAGADAGGGGGPGTATRTVAEERPLSGMQATISDRLGESYRNAVHVTVERELSAATLRGVTGTMRAGGVDVSLTDVLLRAVGAQLAAQPAFNALFEDGTHRLVEEVNVGVAVDVADGLVTPVVPDVTAKSVEEVAAVRRDLTDRVQAGDYTTDDLSGGTFTVSNLGPLGVDSFDPIINPPEVAILGVGRVRDDGTMTLGLSFDHRVVNGADAARFLDGLTGTLTDAGALLDLFAADVAPADAD